MQRQALGVGARRAAAGVATPLPACLLPAACCLLLAACCLPACLILSLCQTHEERVCLLHVRCIMPLNLRVRRCALQTTVDRLQHGGSEQGQSSEHLTAALARAEAAEEQLEGLASERSQLEQELAGAKSREADLQRLASNALAAAVTTSPTASPDGGRREVRADSHIRNHGAISSYNRFLDDAAAVRVYTWTRGKSATESSRAYCQEPMPRVRVSLTLMAHTHALSAQSQAADDSCAEFGTPRCGEPSTSTRAVQRLESDLATVQASLAYAEAAAETARAATAAARDEAR
eukprot:COSAG05_NODE_881_length_6789_cov_21.387743_10_plen_291_part_00